MAGKKTDTIAIDVLLEPDARMLEHAEANNARLLAVLPAGFALDSAHRPHYYEPAPGAGLAGICVAPTPELLELQADVIAAAAPFMLTTGTIDAFTGGHDNPAYDTLLIDYVSGFAAKHAGAGFNPHVTTGIAPIDFLERMVAEPFAAFGFAPASAAVYQLGPFGTAARLLERWE